MELSGSYLPSVFPSPGSDASMPGGLAALVAPSLEYQALAPQWRYLSDIYYGAWMSRDESGEIPITDASEIYLRREPDQSDETYGNRLNTSPYDDRFGQAVRKFVNLIFRNGLTLREIPMLIEPHLRTIGSDHSSLYEFARRVAISALRDGHTFIYITYPPSNNAIRSLADQQNAGRRPYWVHYQALDLVRWKVDYSSIYPVLTLAVLREIAAVDTVDGEELRQRFRILRPGSWQLVEEVFHTDRMGQRQVSYETIGSGSTSLSVIPLVPVYGGLREGYLASRPPLLAMADLNLAHYRVRSDHLRKLHLCCIPVPELRDAMADDANLTISPESVVLIRDPNGSFQWREPLATSIEQSRLEVATIEANMDLLSASYLNNPSDRQSATATLLQGIDLESNLYATASQLSQGLTDALGIHAQYMRLSSGGFVGFDVNVIPTTGTDSQLLLAVSKLAMSDIISKRTLIEVLKRLEFLPPDLDTDAEIQAVGEEIKVRIGSAGTLSPE